MDFLPNEIAEFTERYSQKESKLLQELNRDTFANVLTPRMLAGHLQGRTIFISHLTFVLPVIERQ